MASNPTIPNDATLEAMADEELDALVAEHVMGWALKDGPPYHGEHNRWFDIASGEGRRRRSYWRPTADANDCEMVIEAMRLRQWEIQVDHDLAINEAWARDARRPDNEPCYGCGDDWKRAVVLATLRARREMR